MQLTTQTLQRRHVTKPESSQNLKKTPSYDSVQNLQFRKTSESEHLLQCEHPVYFASKALSDSQKGYVAIELEALAVSWTMEKFHHFLYATKFVLKTDQKPLEAILAKSLNAATPQLQRILIKTFAYDFTVKYLPGKNNQLADCLLRLGCLQDKIKLPRLKVHLLTTRLSAISDKLQQIRQATQDDDTMALLKYTITFGWPNTVQELPKEHQAYWTFREEMTVEDGLILKATRIVIPPTLRESTLQQLHEGHLGFIKCYNQKSKLSIGQTLGRNWKTWYSIVNYV